MPETSFEHRLLEAVPLAVYVFDVVEQRLVHINRGVLHALGYSREELLGQPSGPAATLLHPDDQLRLVRYLRRVRRAGDAERLCFEFRMRTKEGQWRWFRGHDVVLERDRRGVRKVVGVATDITEDRELEEERDRLVSVIEAASDFIAMARPDGSGLYVNRAGRRMTGVGEHEDCRQLRIEQFHSPADSKRIFEEAMPAAARGELARFEVELLHRDGHAIPVSMILTAHRGRDGRIAYFSTIMRDISRERRADAELDRLGAELEDANGRLRALRRSVGELREPIDEIGRASRPLLDGAADELPPRHRDQLERIAEAARELSDLRDALLRES